MSMDHEVLVRTIEHVLDEIPEYCPHCGEEYNGQIEPVVAYGCEDHCEGL